MGIDSFDLRHCVEERPDVARCNYDEEKRRRREEEMEVLEGAANRHAVSPPGRAAGSSVC